MKNLTTVLAKVGHVGELARLLFPFVEDRNGAIGKSELVELANRTAGASHRYPNPIPAFDLALFIGLVKRSGNQISLTTRGQEFVRRPFRRLTDLNLRQGKLVLALLLDDSQVRAVIDRVLAQPNPSEPHSLASVELSESVHQILLLLQQIGAITLENGKPKISSDFEEVLITDYDKIRAGLSEPELLVQLERQRLRGRAAEEVVVKAERERLIKAGRSDFARLVSRISSRNVSAGYDILSFDNDGSRRYIEVKSSIGLKIYFQWSRSERSRAEEFGAQYWIYFVPLSYSLPKLLAPILTIQNPLSFVKSRQLTEHPTNYVVFERQVTRFLTEPTADDFPILRSWP